MKVQLQTRVPNFAEAQWSTANQLCAGAFASCISFVTCVEYPWVRHQGYQYQLRQGFERQRKGIKGTPGAVFTVKGTFFGSTLKGIGRESCGIVAGAIPCQSTANRDLPSSPWGAWAGPCL